MPIEMSSELMLSIISLISGGGLTAIAKLLIEGIQKKRNERKENVDDRIIAWQKISEREEEKVCILDKKIELYNRDFRRLDRYILELEQIIIRADVPIELPDRPTLEKDSPSFAKMNQPEV
jgi:hypothetical protein